MEAGRVELTYVASDMAVGVFGPVLITYVRGSLDLAYLAAADRTGRALAARHPAGIASLTLVPSAMPIPEGRVRQQASRSTKESDQWVTAGATVIAGEGFIASAKRSVLVAMTIFSGGPPRRVFAEPQPAIDWLAVRLDLSPHALDPLAEWSRLSMADDYRELLRAGS
jgi:hypothetical protein